MEDVIAFVLNNYQWLLPSFFSLLSFIFIFFKKGKVDPTDFAKVVASQKVIASALSVLLENKKEKENDVKKES